MHMLKNRNSVQYFAKSKHYYFAIIYQSRFESHQVLKIEGPQPPPTDGKMAWDTPGISFLKTVSTAPHLALPFQHTISHNRNRAVFSARGAVYSVSAWQFEPPIRNGPLHVSFPVD
jgi:hypothetical protein